LFFFVLLLFSLRTELTAKHAKHISDLKSYYEDEIEELKKQLNICALNDTEYNLDTKKIGSKYNYLCFINGCEMIINRRLRDVINTAVQQKLI